MGSGDRPNLSRRLIAETALALTDQTGLSGLSMRKLGSELGVEAMSLYHYVENKDDLLDAVLDCLVGEIDLPFEDEGGDWESKLRQGFSAFNDVLLRHPAAVEIFTTRPAASPLALQVLHWVYQQFEAVGLTPAQASEAFRFAVSFVIGHAANERNMSTGMRIAEDADFSVVGDQATKDFLTEHNKLGADELFEAGLDLLVAGLRARYRPLLNRAADSPDNGVS